jgi:hypothetical protein
MMDRQIGRNVTRNAEVLAAAENLLDQRSNVANKPPSRDRSSTLARRFFIAPDSG